MKENDKCQKNEGNYFFDLISNEKEEEIINLLKDNNKYEIWNFRNKSKDNSTVLHNSVYKNILSITIAIINYVKKYNEKNLISFINEQNDLGITALHYASFRGNLEIIRLLIENGADESILTKSHLNVIHYSAHGNKPSSLMYFYLRFKNRDETENTNLLQLMKSQDTGGSSPLHWAAYSNSEDVLLYLLNLNIFKNEQERQEFIDQKDNQGYTPLHLCVLTKYSRITQKLLQNGVNSNIIDKAGKTPYDVAIDKKLYEIANIIKNSQSCRVCEFKAPVKRIKKNKKNILIVFISLFISSSIMLFSSMPLGLDIGILGKILFCSYCFFLLLFFIIYVSLLYINPGEKQAKKLTYLNGLLENNRDLTNYCYKCYIKKEDNIKHCIICDKCYYEFDHHCYWINKCVAKNNFKLFKIFLIEAFIFLMLNLIIIVLSLIKFIKNKLDIIEDELFTWYYIDKIKDKIFFEYNWLKYVHFGTNIFLALMVLCYIIPEFSLLILHISIWCSNYKTKKNRNVAKKGPILNEVSNSLVIASDDSDE